MVEDDPISHSLISTSIYGEGLDAPSNNDSDAFSDAGDNESPADVLDP